MKADLQPSLFDLETVTDEKIDQRSGTFTDNMKLPVHRWFRYSAGFSAEWVQSEIKKHGRSNIFDPFSGSGTTLVAAETMGASAIGRESHPFVARVAQAKLSWRADIDKLDKRAASIIEQALSIKPDREFPSLLIDCYDFDSLSALESIRLALSFQQDDSNEWRLCWLAYVGILRATSHAGTAQWQYILPNKRKAYPKEPYSAFRLKIEQIKEDVAYMSAYANNPKASLIQEDARHDGAAPSNWADFIITSPPYANNYDYADATRLEMTMLGEMSGWSELQSKVRPHLIRSCTQHVSRQVGDTYEIASSDILLPISDDLLDVVKKLDEARFSHGGKKNYHTMIAHYFYDMAQVWHELRRISKDGAKVCFVVGDSAPYGIYVPVDEWLGKLAVNAGFKSFEFEKMRDRNTKWKNRKHQVPLKEGRLWVND